MTVVMDPKTNPVGLVPSQKECNGIWKKYLEDDLAKDYPDIEDDSNNSDDSNFNNSDDSNNNDDEE